MQSEPHVMSRTYFRLIRMNEAAGHCRGDTELMILFSGKPIGGTVDR